MKIFTVLEPADDNPERVAFVPEGFSWGALAFTELWALWHRMWMVAALLFALTSVLTVAANLELLGSGLAALLNFGIALIFAFEARNLQVKIQASNNEAAELLYFAGRAPSASEATSSRLRAAHDDPLGIFGNV